MANTELTITSEQVRLKEQEIAIVSVRGWLDGKSETTFFSTVLDAKAKGAHCLVIDMEELTMLTSAGVRALLKTYKLFSSAENSTYKVRLCSAQPHVRHALTVTGFLQSIPMHDNLQSALRSFDNQKI